MCGAGPSGNQVSGIVVGPSVQALDIHGGVHFHGMDPRPVIVPRQMAAANRHFTGRRTELEMLRGAADSVGSAVVVLSGPGGAGKTALARQWAHDAAPNFPGGQLCADLSAFGSLPSVDPADVLRSFLRALGTAAEPLPTLLAELTALYRSHTAGRSLLVIVDDAVSAAQVRVLVPASSTSMTVVTSRGRLSGLVADGATLIEVGPLTATDSLALLRKIVGPARIDAETAQAARLTELCAGFPVALCVAAARLSARPRWGVGRVVAALADETDRMRELEPLTDGTSVRGTFELSYRVLDGSAAALYRRLAAHPGRDFGLGPVAALLPTISADLPAAGAGRLIEVLLDGNLVQEIAEERFQLHDLIRLHARQKLESDDSRALQDAALLAILEWYLAAAGRADIMVTAYRDRLDYRYRTAPGELPVFGDREQALAWLERERGNLRAAVRAALDRRWGELAWHLSDVLRPLQLYRTGSDRREIDENGVAAATLWGDPRAEGRMLKRLGRTVTALGEFDVAERHLRRAVARCAEAGDVNGGIEAREMLALCHRDAGRPDAAARLLREVLDARRGLGVRRAIGLTLSNLGEVVLRFGRSAEAVDLLREAAGLLDESAAVDPYNGVRVKIALADAYGQAGDLVAGDRLAAEAVDGMRALGVGSEQARALELSSRIAELRGDLDRSRRRMIEALEVLDRLGSPRAEAARRRVAELAAAAAPQGVQTAGQGLDVRGGEAAVPRRVDREQGAVAGTGDGDRREQ